MGVGDGVFDASLVGVASEDSPFTSGVKVTVGLASCVGVAIGVGVKVGSCVGLGVPVGLDVGIGVEVSQGVGEGTKIVGAKVGIKVDVEDPPHITIPEYKQLEPFQPSLQITCPFD